MKFHSASPLLWSLLFTASFSPAVFAATPLWDGGGADNKWGTAANWSSDTLPTTLSPFDDVQFGGAVRTTVDVDTNVSIRTFKVVTGASAFTLGGTGTITITGTGTGHDGGEHWQNLSSALLTVNNKIIFNGTSMGFRALNGDMTLNGDIDMGSTTNIRFLGNAGRTTTLNGILSGTNSGGTMAFNSGGTFILNQVNTYTQNTSIWTATVKVTVDAPSGANGAFGNSTATINMGTTYPGGALTATLLASNAVTIGRSITLASPLTPSTATPPVVYAPHVFTIGGDTAHVSTFSGNIINTNGAGTKAANKLNVTAAAGGRVNIANIIRGTGAVDSVDDIVKVGAGIVAITGVNNNWQGNTLIQAGTFLVNGTVLTNPSLKNAQVSSGATLGGMGTFRRDVVLVSNAILSPGDMNGAGTSLGGKLTVGDGVGLTLNTGAILKFDLATAASTTDDEVSVAGNLTLKGQLNVTDLGGFSTGAYKLFDWTGILTYTDGDVTFGSMPSGFTYTLDTTSFGNAAYLIVSVPEPARGVLMIAGFSALFLARRRKGLQTVG